MVGTTRAAGLAIALASAVVLLGACGSDGGGTASGSLPAGTAEELASLSDGIADSLEAGDTCDAAHKADELQTAVSEADIPDDLRGEVEAGADQLVNDVNCEEQEDRTTKEEHGGGEEDEDESSGEGSEGSDEEPAEEDSGGPPGQDEGFTPPGQQGNIKGGI